MSDPREPLPSVNRRMLVVGFCVYSLFLLFPIFALLVSQDAKATAPPGPEPAAVALEARAKRLADEAAGRDAAIGQLRAELAKEQGEARAAREQLAELRREADRLESAAAASEESAAKAEAGRLDAAKRLADLQASLARPVERKQAAPAANPPRAASPKASAGATKKR